MAETILGGGRAKFLEYFMWKITILRQKNHIFSNFRGALAGAPPPESAPGVIVSVFAWSSVDRGFELRSGQTKDYNIGICCFSTKQAALRSKSKDELWRNQDNVPKWGYTSIRGLLLIRWANTMKIQLTCKHVGLVQSNFRFLIFIAVEHYTFVV
jgi:hypothetical protein